MRVLHHQPAASGISGHPWNMNTLVLRDEAFGWLDAGAALDATPRLPQGSHDGTELSNGVHYIGFTVRREGPGFV